MDDYKELCELLLDFKFIKFTVPPTNNLDDMENLTLVPISDMSDEQIKWTLQNSFKDETTYDSRVKSIIAMLKFARQYDPSNNTV